jgi:putative PIN family toxin of toxin-antitoxin system
LSTTTAGRAELRVVLDTNVYVSAFARLQGPPFGIWNQALRRSYVLLVSPAILAEVGGVLRSKFLWDDGQVVRRLKLVAKVAEIITPRADLDAVPEDDDDNRILECAVAGNADLIVSGDQHLRRLRSFRGIAIVRPTDFQRILAR